MKFYFLLLILIFQKGYSQNRPLKIGLSYSPGISSFSTNNKSYKKDYSAAFSYQTGVFLIKNIGSKVDFRTGVIYSRYSKSFEPDLSWDGADNIPGYTFKEIFNNYYIEFPLGINFYFVKKKIGFYFLAGIKPGVYLFSKTISYLYYENTLESKDKYKTVIEKNRFNVMLFSGLGLSYSTEKYTFFFEPIFEHSLVNNSSKRIKAIYKSYPYFFGVNLGGLYTFGHR